MNLVVDIGNSSSKIGVFKNREQVFETRIENFDVSYFNDLIEQQKIKKCIVSSVRDTRNLELIPFLKSKTDVFLLLDENTPLPVKNCYETPATLGKDRLAAVIGANYFYPESDVLVIDSGTAITFDFINKNKEYLGGNISPGLEMRYKALNHFTNKLPLLSKTDLYSLLGRNTNSAINNGIINGIIFEINGYVSELKIEYADLKVVLTGGDGNFFAKKLKRTIFVVANLVLVGLNRILEYNEI